LFFYINEPKELWIPTSFWWKLLNTASRSFKCRFAMAAATCGKVSGWGSKTRLYLKGLRFINAVSTFKNLTISWTTSFHSLKSLSCNQIVRRSLPIHLQMSIYQNIFWVLDNVCFASNTPVSSLVQRRLANL